MAKSLKRQLHDARKAEERGEQLSQKQLSLLAGTPQKKGKKPTSEKPVSKPVYTEEEEKLHAADTLAPPPDIFMPAKVDDVDLAFPGDVNHLMPPGGYPVTSAAKRLAEEWFFEGIKGSKFMSIPGVNPKDALRHIQCILGSFQPKHEVKMYAAARLLDLWFEGWKTAKSDYVRPGLG